MTKYKRGFGRELLKPTANSMFARKAGTMANITGLVNQSELSIIEMKTLTNLTHESLGL